MLACEPYSDAVGLAIAAGRRDYPNQRRTVNWENMEQLRREIVRFVRHAPASICHERAQLGEVFIFQKRQLVGMTTPLLRAADY